MSFFLNPSLGVMRASGDLRRGFPVNVDKYSIVALETLVEDVFTEFASKILVVPSCSIIGTKHDEEFLFYHVNGLSSDKILSLLLDSNFSEFKKIQICDFDIESVRSAIHLVKQSELLPFILISTDKLDGAIDVTSEDIKKCSHQIMNDIYKTAEADLNLKYANKARILSFRSRFTAQDHYAIVIGDISNIETPCVRIHSSCYTGDLMASLSCDCRDQLLETVKFMSKAEENAGIILYLMQEGRGIGLTNKIRAYKLQQQGYDTIEANHMLGFEEDERIFDTAGRILEIMNIENVKLLTNNPCKINALEMNGIKVLKTISLYGSINEYNKDYLATKKNKMGHNL